MGQIRFSIVRSIGSLSSSARPPLSRPFGRCHKPSRLGHSMTSTRGIGRSTNRQCLCSKLSIDNDLELGLPPAAADELVINKGENPCPRLGSVSGGLTIAERPSRSVPHKESSLDPDASGSTDSGSRTGQFLGSGSISRKIPDGTVPIRCILDADGVQYRNLACFRLFFVYPVHPGSWNSKGLK